MIDRMLSTGEVAKVLGVSVRKAVQLIDSKIIKGWKIPGSQHRRVEEKNLREFMREFGISEDRLEMLS